MNTEQAFPVIRQTVLDTTDPRRLAEFYRQLFGLRYCPDDEPPGPGQPDPAGQDWLILTSPAGGAALLAATCLLGLSPALIAESGPARAAGTTQSPSGRVPPEDQVRIPGCRPQLLAPAHPVPPRPAPAGFRAWPVLLTPVRGGGGDGGH